MGFRYLVEKHDGKGYDSGNTPRWNLEIKPFVIRKVIQIEGNT
jgi:hypothetical protein